jgi:DNA-binding cell septation regulator SpoVG
MSETQKAIHTIHEIGEVRVRPVPNATDGLVAFVSCRYGGVFLNDIAIRRDASGHLFLTYPRKLGSSGRPHPLHHPVDRTTADQFESVIIGQLRMVMGADSEGGARPEGGRA